MKTLIVALVLLASAKSFAGGNCGNSFSGPLSGTVTSSTVSSVNSSGAQ